MIDYIKNNPGACDFARFWLYPRQVTDIVIALVETISVKQAGALFHHFTFTTPLHLRRVFRNHDREDLLELLNKHVNPQQWEYYVTQRGMWDKRWK